MDKIIILDFGGQYCHLISRRIRDLGIYSEILSADTKSDEILKHGDVRGLILSGGAQSVYDKNSPKCSPKLLEIGVPILGICYGHQLISSLEGGKVASGKAGEYGITDMKVLSRESVLLKGLSNAETVWMNHKDIVRKLPTGYQVAASTADSPVAAFENPAKRIYGVQFHPEVTHTPKGQRILRNFAVGICKAKKGWSTADIVDRIRRETKETLGNRRAVIGLSGGVDSSAAAVIVAKAIGKNLTAVYVDTGLMREKETDFIRKTFKSKGLNLKIVDASKLFFENLAGVTDPEQKRKIIGRLFVEVFDKEAKKTKAEYLIQGTIYSDRIESGLTKHSSVIKSHHNVGGLPKDMKLKVYEPLRDLYKDEVRRIAAQVGLGDEITKRHVFPGPGLAVRILGEVTPPKALVVRKASAIIEEELKKANLYHKVWMGFAVLLPIRSVGIQGDARSYKYPVVVRIIESKDAMTANFSRLPYSILQTISTRITNEIADVNRVVYDISNKPPSTMEWE